MGQLKDDLTHTRHETGEKLLSMEGAIDLLRYQVEQIDDRFDKMFDQITSVSVNKFSLNKHYSLFDIQFQRSLNWIMGAMARVKMDKDPPFLVQKTRKHFIQLTQLFSLV